MSVFHGPTRPLQVPPPQARDDVESKRLSDAMTRLSCGSTESTVRLVESVAQCVVEQVIAETGGRWVRAYPFGSSGLAASVAGSDIDIVVFCPFKVTSEYFFAEFPSLLRQYVGDVVVVFARVPVVKFAYEGTAVDVVFVSVALSAPPTTEQLLSNSFFLQVSRETRRSVNGLRTILELRRHIPVAYNVFTTTLKAVKTWAMKRQVYGSHYTYPGGVAFAVMVARACQLMPSSYPSVVLRFFFAFYTQWLSRHDRILPVYITASLENQGRIQGLPESWDPQREICREDLFPVINPAYPYVNDANNIGRCGLEAFYTEITRAHQVLSDSNSPLERIWEPYHITYLYNQFLLVQVFSWAENEEDAKRFHATWSSYVASKLRFLIYDMEQLVDVRPYPHKIDNNAVKQTGQYRAFVGECFFVLAVKERNSETKLNISMFFESFQRFRYVLADGCVNTEDGMGFVFSREAMRGPYFRLVDAAHLPFNLEK